jgi:hypothetical protein
MTDTDKRTEKINGLRDLADFLEQHPDMPDPHIVGFWGFVHGEGEEGLNVLFDLAESVGADVLRKPGNDYEVKVTFRGGVVYELFFKDDSEPPTASVVVTRPKRDSLSAKA